MKKLFVGGSGTRVIQMILEAGGFLSVTWRLTGFTILRVMTVPL